MPDEHVEEALRALRHRDRSAHQVDRYLELHGVAERDRREVLATLARTGLVDDRRYAESRASALAGRGAGDAFIRHDLTAAGIETDLVDEALAALATEAERAREIVARRGASAKTARYLAGKGFSEDVVHAVVARSSVDALG